MRPGKCNDPEHHGDRGRGLLLDAKNFRQGDEAGDLRAAAHPGKLQHRSDQRHREQQHRAREIHIGVEEGFAERLGDPQINQSRKDPVQRRIENRRQQVGSSPDGLQPFADSRDRRSEAAPETARSAPTLEAAVQDRRAVQSVDDQNCNQASHRAEQQPAAALRAIHPIHIRAGVGQAVGKDKQGEASQDRGRGEVAEPFQKENSEHAGDRETFFARQEQGPDGLAGSSQNKNRREAHQRPGERVHENQWGRHTCRIAATGPRGSHSTRKSRPGKAEEAEYSPGRRWR